MVDLQLSCDQVWIHIRSSGHLNQIRSNVCHDWNTLTISVDSVCHLVHNWLTQIDRSRFDIVEYEFKPVKWRIEHTESESDDKDKKELESDKKSEEGVDANKAPEMSKSEKAEVVVEEGKELNADKEATPEPIPESIAKSKRFLIGVLISQAQLFDLICAFLDDAPIQTLPYTTSESITIHNTKRFYLTREVQVVCLASETVYEWYIMNNDEPVWKTYDDVIAAALLDLIYQRGNVELITWQNQQLKRYPKILNKYWGEIAIGPEMLRHYSDTGKFGLHSLPERENNFVKHSLSYLRTDQIKYDPRDF